MNLIDPEIRVVEHICWPGYNNSVDAEPCGGSYECDVCQREVGWCFGCDDEEDREHMGICDLCWCQLYGHKDD